MFHCLNLPAEPPPPQLKEGLLHCRLCGTGLPVPAVGDRWKCPRERCDWQGPIRRHVETAKND
mgnify:CR=1 FL=1